jgi:hypothetical protein
MVALYDFGGDAIGKFMPGRSGKTLAVSFVKSFSWVSLV